MHNGLNLIVHGTIMHILLILIIIFLCIYAPGLWAQNVLNHHNQDEFFSGNGYDLAQLLLHEAGISHIAVEQTTLGDHYDPVAKVVRLNPRYCGRKSLSGVVVAAHEVGHAIQDAQGYVPLSLRTRLAGFAQTFEKLGVGIIMAAPLITALTRVPTSGVLFFLVGIAGIGTPLIVHLITLPVELDASFNRAIPFLMNGRYIPRESLDSAKKILMACALTYVAGALSGLFNVWRWIRLLRR